MDVQAYFKSLALEINAVKDRVQNLIGSSHWPSVGAWKESVLRSVLRRHLPANIKIASGFVHFGDKLSTQIDILIYDDSGPTLFQDGDLVIVTPEVVRAAIEVKTRINRTDILDILQKADTVAQLFRSSSSRPFIGVFAYEDPPLDPNFLLETLKQVNGSFGKHTVRCISIGSKQFVRFWGFRPRDKSLQFYNSWHCYNLDGIAQAYFIHNVIEHIFPKSISLNSKIWYPVDGKESDLAASIQRDMPPTDTNQRKDVRS